MARLLVMVHFRLQSAHCGSHRQRAFTPFEFLVTLLEGRILHPATLRYSIQILLSMLQHRWGPSAFSRGLHAPGCGAALAGVGCSSDLLCSWRILMLTAV